eukprot:m51a1_g884 hypothetical protein (495) ;mRNA; r:890363-892165
MEDENTATPPQASEGRKACTLSAVLPKALYFAFFAASATINPYLVTFYDRNGYDEQSIGLLLSITPFVSLACTPVWTAAADKTHRHGLLLNIAFVISSVVLFAQYWGVARLYLLSALIILHSSTRCAVSPILDSIVVRTVGRQSYGAQRVWGSISWGIFTFLCGLMLSKAPPIWMFVANLAINGATFVTFLALQNMRTNKPEPARSEGNDAAAERATASSCEFLRRMGKAVSSWRMLLLLIRSFFSGAAHSVLMFLFLFLNTTFHTGKELFGLYGLCFTVGMVTEIPVLMFQRQLVERVGDEVLMLVSHAAIAARFLLYTFIPGAWWVLPVELLHGIFFGCFWGPGVSQADKLAPPGLGATAQGLFTSCFSGLGSGTGYFLGGIVFRRFGAVVLFRGASAIMAGLFVVTGIAALVVRSRASQQAEPIPLVDQSQQDDRNLELASLVGRESLDTVNLDDDASHMDISVDVAAHEQEAGDTPRETPREDERKTGTA